MRILNIICKIILVIAIAISGIGIIVAAFTLNDADIIFLSFIEANSLILSCAIIGAFLNYSKNDTIKKLGNGLMLSGFITGFMCAITTFTTISIKNKEHAFLGSKVPVSSGAIIMIISFSIFVLYYLFLLIGHLITKILLQPTIQM